MTEGRKRSDELLAEMIPRTIAEKVKIGLNPVDTWEVRANLFERWVLRAIRRRPRR